MQSCGQSRRRSLAAVLWVGVAVLFSAIGCGPAYRPLPYKPAADDASLKILACHDGVGHIVGHKPWILGRQASASSPRGEAAGLPSPGGTCCCTPTPENYALHVSQGTIDRTMSYEQYLALYKERGIVTDLDHKGCGNLCDHGPHVLLGGRCMATPTPGTLMYERVTYGPHTPLSTEMLPYGEAQQAPLDRW